MRDVSKYLGFVPLINPAYKNIKPKKRKKKASLIRQVVKSSVPHTEVTSANLV